MSINDNTWQEAIARILGESGARLTWQRALAMLAGQLEDFMHGHFPGMTSGVADNISGDPTTSTFPSSTQCDGMAEVESIQGNTVRWNQLVNYTTATTNTVNDVTFTNNGDGTFTVNGTASAATIFNIGPVATGKLNHKTLIKGCPAGGSATTFRLKNSYGAGSDLGSGLIESDVNDNCIAQINIASGYHAENLVFKPQIFDLTAMFGAGNEPSTVAEFEAQFSESFYPYDSGSLLSVNMSGIQTKDADENSVDSVEIPVATYFPTGIKSAGNAHDALYEDHADTVIGAVDLGTISWVRAATSTADIYRVRSENVLSGALKPSANNVNANILCAKYKTSNASASFTKVEGIDIGSDGYIHIYDTSFNTGTTEEISAAAHTATNGVILYYEIENPTTTIIDPPLSMRYQVAEGGTESIIPAGTGNPQSAQPTITARYPQSFDMVRDASLGVIAPVENGKASTNYAIGSYLVNNGKLCKVTSAIASGEDVVQGTNCTETTVMAEVVTLTS